MSKKQMILDLYHQHPEMTGREIGAEVGLSAVRVNTILRENGIKRKAPVPRSEWKRRLQPIIMKHPEYTYKQYAEALDTTVPTISNTVIRYPILKSLRHSLLVQKKAAARKQRKPCVPRGAIAKKEAEARSMGMTYGRYVAMTEHPVCCEHTVGFINCE